jgi:Ribosomal protein L7/L12 C-terminal domain
MKFGWQEALILFMAGVAMGAVVVSLAVARRGAGPMPGPGGAGPGTGGQQLSPEQRMELVRTHIAQGRKINAIKELRAATGMGLKAAKECVEAMEAGHPGPVALRLGQRPAQPASPAQPWSSGQPGSLAERVRTLMAGSGSSAAMELIRSETGMNSQEAEFFIAAVTKPGN